MDRQKAIALQRRAGQLVANAARSGSPAQKKLAKKYAASMVKRSFQ